MKTVNLGDTLETAIWLDGRESEAQIERFKADVRNAIAEGCELHRCKIGNVEFHEKRPGDPRVPVPPDHIQGPDVRLLVAEARVIAKTRQSFFTQDLEPDDLALLRGITRRAYARHYPGKPRLTDRQCDTLINDNGPEAAVAALKGLRKSELVH